MLYILTNLQRGDNQWTYGVIDAVKKEFTRRRLKYAEVTNIKDTIRKCAAHGDPILIPTPVTALLLPIVEECNKQGVQVIVPNGFLNIGERYRYHCVKGDFYGAVAHVLQGLRGAKKGDVALFGMNTNSQEDVLVTDAFVAQNSGASGSIFCNDGSIRQCFEKFYQMRYNFNSVICTNDYVAIYLIEQMRRLDPTYVDKTYIVSFSNTILSRLYTMPFTSLAPDMDALGCAVGDIYKLVKRSGDSYRAISIYVGYKIYERGNAECFGQLGKGSYVPYESKDVFFPTINAFNEANAYNNDPEVERLPRIEIFLNQLTRVELSILMMVLQGYNNAHISEALFLSGETVRYHLNKMRSLLGCNSREEMREALQELIVPEHIEAYLSENRAEK